MIPSNVHAGSSISFIQKSASVHNIAATATSISSPNMPNTVKGDVIVVDIYGIGAFDSFSVTDGPGNTYTENVRSITSSGGGISTYIYTATLGASGLLSIVVSTGGVMRGYTFTAAEYNGVVGFGATTTAQNDNIGNTNTVTSTISFSGVGSSSWIAENLGTEQVTTGTASFGNGQVSRDQTNCNNTGTNCILYDVPAPGTTFTLSTTISGIGCGTTAPPCAFTSNSALELLGSPILPGTLVTNCYGNCGTPPITTVNTNSTKSINFNQSITLFYEFQSNINGVINNVTLNYANTCGSNNRCSVNTLFIAAYSAGICSSVSQPFTSACPGSRLSQISFSPPGKGKLSMTCPSTCGVTSGQWLGIAISASFSGIEINDTNTNVPLFQANGITPITISSSSSAASLCSGCKMGLWTWITGSVVTGPGNNIPNSGNCGNGIGDYLTCLTLTFCTGTPNAGCQLAGGLFWGMIYSVVGIVGLMWVDHKFLGSESGVHVPASGYAFIPLGIQFMFVSLGVLPVWWGILLIMVFTVLFTWILLGFARGSSGRPT